MIMDIEYAKKVDTADNFISYDVLYEKGHISLNEKA